MDAAHRLVSECAADEASFARHATATAFRVPAALPPAGSAAALATAAGDNAGSIPECINRAAAWVLNVSGELVVPDHTAAAAAPSAASSAPPARPYSSRMGLFRPRVTLARELKLSVRDELQQLHEQQRARGGGAGTPGLGPDAHGGDKRGAPPSPSDSAALPARKRSRTASMDQSRPPSASATPTAATPHARVRTPARTPPRGLQPRTRIAWCEAVDGAEWQLLQALQFRLNVVSAIDILHGQVRRGATRTRARAIRWCLTRPSSAIRR